MHRLRALALLLFAFVLLASCGGGSDASDSAAETTSTTDQTAENAVDDSTQPTASTTDGETGDTTAPAADAEQDATTAIAEPEPANAEPAVADAGDAVQPVVYNNDFSKSIAPIFQAKCASCHNAGGPGATHWQLENAGDLVATHEWIASVVETQYMPPWPSSELSLLFHENRSMTSDQIAAVAAWSSSGATLDVSETTPIAAPSAASSLAADVEIDPNESYQGSTAVSDDYRCLIYDPQLTEPTWMGGFEFVPDQVAVVHHAVGYVVGAASRADADTLTAQDEAGGYQCYGGTRVNDSGLFIGWAPGQLATEYPEGSGILMEPGDFFVIQVHYHYDVDAPADASTLKVDWVDGGDLDPIVFTEYLGPAEIPCGPDEAGPLCDRAASIARARAEYGLDGALADAVNQNCGVTPDDFALVDGVASSQCVIPVGDFGEIVGVFGHQHEIGKSIRLTLNAGTADEQILLDIPDWSFDWQLNYVPVDSVVLSPGDDILLECSWDRGRRDPNLEPAYVLWADGTNDEMCFASITTRQLEEPAEAPADDAGAEEVELPAALATCLEAGGAASFPPARSEIDTTTELLFSCATPDEVGTALAGVLSSSFGGLLAEENTQCLAAELTTRDAAQQFLAYSLEDSSPDERQPVGELVGQCVSLAATVTAAGLPVPPESVDCVDESGRELLINTVVTGETPDQMAIFTIISNCQ